MSTKRLIQGFCFVGDKNIRCFFTLLDFRVTLIAAALEDCHAFREWGWNRIDGEDLIYGTTSEGKDVVFIIIGSHGFTFSTDGGYEIHFYTKYFLYGNRSDNIRESFRGLLFYSDSINDFFPQFSLTQMNDNQNGIIVRSKDEYTYTYSINIDNQCFVIEISADINISYSVRSGTEIKNKGAYIKIVCAENQKLKDYWIYHDYIYNLISFCLGHKDICFKVKLLDYVTVPKIQIENTNIERFEKESEDVIESNVEIKLGEVMDCHIFWGDRIYTPIKEIRNVLRIDKINKKLPKLFEVLNSKADRPSLAFLAENESMINRIRAVDIHLICAAIEREFSFYEKEQEKQSDYLSEVCFLSKELRYKIKHSEVSNKVKEKAYNFLGMLRTMKYSLREKTSFLLKEFESVLYDVCHQSSLSNKEALTRSFSDISEFNKMFTSFQKMRNSGSHGVFVWEEDYVLYVYLVFLVYASILYRSGYTKNEITEILKSVFRSRIH